MNTTSPKLTNPVRASAPPVRNGNGNEMDTLPEHRQKMVEAANAAYQHVLAEREDLDRQLHEANKKIEALTVQVEALKSVVNMMESTYLQTKLEMENRISTHQAERDDAVRDAASHQATLANIYVIVRNHINEPDS
jgi:chromosome segregation ATPase